MTQIVDIKRAASPLRECVSLRSDSNPTNHYGGAAMAQYNIGVDYHKKFSYFVVKDQSGKVLRNGQVQNTFEHVSRFLQPFKEDSQAVLESCRNWCVMHDWLEEIVDDVVLANPFKVKAIAEAKIKTDKIDATVLADLLRADLIPQCYIASRDVRDMRGVLRERMFFVRLRTMTKNRITTIFDRYPEEARSFKKLSDLYGKKGRVQLETIKVREADRALIDRELNFIDLINEFIKETEEVISTNFRESQNAQYLKSLPGIGQFFAMLIDAEVGDINRFKNANKFAAYVGLVPSTYSSGGKTVNGRIIKRGNKLLRWAFVEAVIPAITHNEELRFEYDELRKRMNWNKAKVAIARKLLKLAYKCLKEKRNFKKLNKLELERKVLMRAS
jgi:transposase